MSLASGPRSLGSFVRTQSSWVLCQDPRFLGLGFSNIIICLINIIIFFIIQSIHLKNKIIYVINIIIFIISQSIHIKKNYNLHLKYYYFYYNSKYSYKKIYNYLL